MKTSWLNITEWTLALGLSGLVLWLMTVRLMSPGGLWRDEAACVQLATMPTIADVWNNFEHEAFPPPIPLLIRAYTEIFGTSTFALRGFGFAVSCLLVISIWLTSWILHRHPPLISMALLGLNSSVLIWAGALRGYGLASVFIPLAFATTARIMKKPSTGWWTAALLTTVCSVQCTLQNSLLVLTIGLSAAMVAAVKREYRTAVIVLLVGGLSALTLAPYLPRYASADWKKIVEGRTIFLGYVNGFLFNLGRPRVEMAWVWGTLWAAALMGSGFYFWRRKRCPENQSSLMGYGWLVVVLSLVFYFAFLMYMKYRPRPWHYLPLLTVLACNLEMLLAICLTSWIWRLIRIGIVVLLVAFFTGPAYQLLNVRLTNLDVAADILEQKADENDLIVVSPWYFGVGFRWHYHGDTPWMTLPILGDMAVHRYDQVIPRMLSPTPLEDLKENIQATLMSGGRVWIVGDLLGVPPEGPTFLHPAPDPEAGWNEELYIASWMQQLTDFMQRHCRTVVPVKIEVEGPVAGAEDVKLWMGRGWK